MLSLKHGFGDMIISCPCATGDFVMVRDILQRVIGCHGAIKKGQVTSVETRGYFLVASSSIS